MLKKYRKKPVIDEAEQWFPGSPVEGVETLFKNNKLDYYVTTAHDQIVILQPGDYVIKEQDNRGYYPCKPDIFEKNHEMTPIE